MLCAKPEYYLAKSLILALSRTKGVSIWPLRKSLSITCRFTKPSN